MYVSMMRFAKQAHDIGIGSASVFNDFVEVVCVACFGRGVTSRIETFLITNDKHEPLHRRGITS